MTKKIVFMLALGVQFAVSMVASEASAIPQCFPCDASSATVSAIPQCFPCDATTETVSAIPQCFPCDASL